MESAEEVVEASLFFNIVGFFFGVLWWLIDCIFSMAIGAIFLLWYHQSRLIYMCSVQGRKRQISYNEPAIYRSPKMFALDFEDLYIQARDRISFHAWLCKAKNYSSV